MSHRSSKPIGAASERRVLQLYHTREMAPTLLPVLATMLHFSPAEVAKCQEAATDAPAGARNTNSYEDRDARVSSYRA